MLACSRRLSAVLSAFACCVVATAQGVATAQNVVKPVAAAADTHALAAPAFDTASIDKTVDPCTDFYKFSCGNFVKNHPIPSDQSGVDEFYLLYNVNTEAINGIITKLAAESGTGAAGLSANAQKIGDTYASCMDTDAIEKKNLAPLQPLLDEIDHTGKADMPLLAGKLQRIGVNAFFSYGEMQDFKDASKQIAVVDQGGLGLPERDYYIRSGDKDKQIRDQYVAHITKMLTFAGDPPQKALIEARAILDFETLLARASDDITKRRDPEAIYHLEPIATFQKSIPYVNFNAFLDGIHSQKVAEINVTNLAFFPAMRQAILDANLDTLHAYLRYQTLTTFANRMPKRIDDENFDFYGRKLNGQPEQRPRWKRCSQSVDTELGEALGQVYVTQYFPAAAKAKTLEMVTDIEHAMDKDIDSLTWMSPETKVRAKQKLVAVANKIGYPDKWRDYSSLMITRDDALGDEERATAFENDRQLAKIGQPVDKAEWGMTPPTVNAYYDPSMNNINFPAGILQPAFYDPKADDAVNYGHIGAVIGHELTHGFDDQGKKFGPTGNLDDWWTAKDTSNFEARTACLANEYSNFVAVGTGADAVHVNGKLTLGENTADNGGLLLAYMAYLERAKKEGIQLDAKLDGFTSPQRFYIAFAQNYCENSRDEQVRNQVLTDPHSPDHFRANGSIVNQPGFGPAFGCKVGSPMVPANNCRIW